MMRHQSRVDVRQCEHTHLDVNVKLRRNDALVNEDLWGHALPSAFYWTACGTGADLIRQRSIGVWPNLANH